MLRVLLALLSASACLAHVVVPQPCPHFEKKKNFDVARYSGKWYQIESFYSDIEKNGRCVTATYTPNEDGTLRVENSLISNLNDELVTINGTATFAGNTTDGDLVVSFSNDPSEPKAPYWVVDTDYDNWAVVYSCEETADISYRFCWIITREQYPSSEVLAKADKAIDHNMILKTFFVKTDHTNCTVSA